MKSGLEWPILSVQKVQFLVRIENVSESYHYRGGDNGAKRANRIAMGI